MKTKVLQASAIILIFVGSVLITMNYLNGYSNVLLIVGLILGLFVAVKKTNLEKKNTINITSREKFIITIIFVFIFFLVISYITAKFFNV